MTVLNQNLRDAALLALLNLDGGMPVHANQLWNAMRPYLFSSGNLIDETYPYELKQMKEEGLIEIRRRMISRDRWGQINWKRGWKLTEEGREAAREVQDAREA